MTNLLRQGRHSQQIVRFLNVEWKHCLLGGPPETFNRFVLLLKREWVYTDGDGAPLTKPPDKKKKADIPFANFVDANSKLYNVLMIPKKDHLPPKFVHLCDYVAGGLLRMVQGGREGLTLKGSYEFWPSTFNSYGLVRTDRPPMGIPSMMLSNKTWYYASCKGIYILMASEGFDATNPHRHLTGKQYIKRTMVGGKAKASQGSGSLSVASRGRTIYPEASRAATTASMGYTAELYIFDEQLARTGMTWTTVSVRMEKRQDWLRVFGMFLGKTTLKTIHERAFQHVVVGY